MAIFSYVGLTSTPCIDIFWLKSADWRLIPTEIEIGYLFSNLFCKIESSSLNFRFVILQLSIFKTLGTLRTINYYFIENSPSFLSASKFLHFEKYYSLPWSWSPNSRFSIPFCTNLTLKSCLDCYLTSCSLIVNF